MQRLQILLVDDTPQVLAVVRLSLRRFLKDCELFEAENLEDAKALFDLNPEISLVISDFHLEDGNGLEFQQWVQERRKVGFLLMSGTYSFHEEEPFEFIAKPIDMEELEKKVHKLLAERGRA